MAQMLSLNHLLAVMQPWTDVAVAIHQRLATLIGPEQGHEVLWVGSGAGRAVLWWAQRFQLHTLGLDPDPEAVEQAERSARASELAALTAFHVGSPADLPFEAQVFDIVVADFLHLSGLDNREVVKELGRVARPMATVAALVPIWLATPDPEPARVLVSLGIQPRVLMEWKQWFREAGVVDLVAESAAADGAWLAYGKVGMLVRAWRVARWAGVRAVFRREVRTLRTVARRRVLGVSIVKGTRWPHEA
ncbi:MAG TPA: class I SAM-dependent methyltransferase [Gemmatimonadales bacterium]|jgi:SAM-dependent methyltransferase